MDTFFEYLVKRKKTAADFAIIALTIFACIIIVFLLFALYRLPLISILAFPLQVLVVYLAFKFITRRNVEFEYSVTNGDIEIDKILNKQKRAHLVSVESKSISIMAPLGDGRIPSVNEKNIIDASSGTNADNTYCVVYGDGSRNLLIFEPTRKMVEEIQKRNPRNVFPKD